MGRNLEALLFQLQSTLPKIIRHRAEYIDSLLSASLFFGKAHTNTRTLPSLLQHRYPFLRLVRHLLFFLHFLPSTMDVVRLIQTSIMHTHLKKSGISLMLFNSCGRQKHADKSTQLIQLYSKMRMKLCAKNVLNHSGQWFGCVIFSRLNDAFPSLFKQLVNVKPNFKQAMD